MNINRCIWYVDFWSCSLILSGQDIYIIVTHSLTHSLTHPHPLTHWLTHRPTPTPHPPTHSPTHSIIHSLTHTPTHPLTDPLIQPPPLTHSLTHSFTHSLTRPFQWSNQSQFCKHHENRAIASSATFWPDWTIIFHAHGPKTNRINLIGKFHSHGKSIPWVDK